MSATSETQTENRPQVPLVLCISGHDPSGGAGIQADIEAIRACGGFANTLPSCLTVQNHHRVARVVPVELGLLRDMLESLLEVSSPRCVKIGLLGHAEQAEWLAAWLDALPTRLPVVLDPVIHASDGSQLSQAALLQSIKQHLLPQVSLLTPNTQELHLLSGHNSVPVAIQHLQSLGCEHILLTGGDEPGSSVHNQLFGPDNAHREWHMPRLANRFHGSGCTLSAATASFLAQGLDVENACDRAQTFTHRALASALQLDDGPLLPSRHS